MGNEIYDTLKTFYIGNYNRLCNYVSTYIGNDRLSRDLVHDAFLVVMDKYIHPPDEKRYNKIITKILKNSIMTYFRESKNTIPLDGSFFDNIEMKVSKVEPENDECIKKLVYFFEKLENPGKLILYLSMYEGFTLAHIARMTGEKQRNVYFWKNKAIEELRENMEKAGYKDG